MKKILPYIIKTIVGIMVLLVIIFCWLSWVMFQDHKFYMDSGIQYTVIELLQIPYSFYKHIPGSLKPGLHDLEPISYEEWMSMECECPNTAAGTYDPWLPSATDQELEMLGIEGQKHIMCLQPGAFIQKWFANKMPKDCPNQLQCDTMKIQVFDYVLKYPKVLNNLIKIVEKPCFYVKDLPKEPELKSNMSKKERKRWNMYYSIKQTREELHCNDNSRPRTIIRILNKEGQAKYDIIVPRLDTAKLRR